MLKTGFQLWNHFPFPPLIFNCSCTILWAKKKTVSVCCEPVVSHIVANKVSKNATTPKAQNSEIALYLFYPLLFVSSQFKVLTKQSFYNTLAIINLPAPTKRKHPAATLHTLKFAPVIWNLLQRPEYVHDLPYHLQAPFDHQRKHMMHMESLPPPAPLRVKHVCSTANCPPRPDLWLTHTYGVTNTRAQIFFDIMVPVMISLDNCWLLWRSGSIICPFKGKQRLIHQLWLFPTSPVCKRPQMSHLHFFQNVPSKHHKKHTC